MSSECVLVPRLFHLYSFRIAHGDVMIENDEEEQKDAENVGEYRQLDVGDHYREQRTRERHANTTSRDTWNCGRRVL